MESEPRRPGLPTGRSGTPLLYHADGTSLDTGARGRISGRSSPRNDEYNDADTAPLFDAERPTLSRQSTTGLMHSRNPQGVMATAKESARKTYILASIFLAISLVAFCVQTELSEHIQHTLKWNKAYCMMYLTHTSWVVLWPVTIAVQRMQQRDVPWNVFWRRHMELVSSTVAMIELQTINVSAESVRRRARPFMYLGRMTAYITSALTVAGVSWYVAVSMTTAADLTAIYNCSAFFAYVFSVPILHEPLRTDKSIAVLIAILGVLVVAYGDTGTADDGSGDTPESRFAGNLIIGVGSVLYGLYEVLYKRYACPPEGVSPGRGTVFATVFGSCIGFFTLTVLWIPLPILHWLGIETFVVPDAHMRWLILVAVLSNAIFSGCFLVLISLTSPVLSSVAALLTIFIVAIADWFLKGQPLSFAAIVGGSMIIVAFVGLSWSTYREMMEHKAQKLAVDLSDSDDDDKGSDSE